MPLTINIDLSDITQAFVTLICKQFGLSEENAIAEIAKANQRYIEMYTAARDRELAKYPLDSEDSEWINESFEQILSELRTEGVFTQTLLEKIDNRTACLKFDSEGLAWSWADIEDQDEAEALKQGEAAVIEFIENSRENPGHLCRG